MSPRSGNREQRPDGRSDRHVLIDLVGASTVGTEFTYDDLYQALAADLSEPPDRKRLYRAVADANRTLYRDRARFLDPVRGTGYRVTEATDTNGGRLRFVRHKLDRDVFDVYAGDPPQQIGTVRRAYGNGRRSYWRVLTTTVGPLPTLNRFRTRDEAAVWLRRQINRNTTPPTETQ